MVRHFVLLRIISNTTAAVVTANLSGIYLGAAAVINAATFSVGAALTANSTAIVFTGATINASSASANLLNLTISGNLFVTGQMYTVGTNVLQVNDNFIEVTCNNTTTDVIDGGIYSPAGNSTAIWYSGFGRVASKSTNNMPWFWAFGSNTNPNTGLTLDQTSNSVTATIQAFLRPYGANAAFVANSTVVQINANSTIAAALVANSLTLTTALSTNGGTGVLTSAYAAGDLLYAATATPASLTRLTVPGSAANGQVLQITNNLPAYGVLDAGTF